MPALAVCMAGKDPTGSQKKEVYEINFLEQCILRLLPDFPLESRENELTYGQPNWFDRVKEEHLACRKKVALFDMSAFAKIEIEVPHRSPHYDSLFNISLSPPPLPLPLSFPQGPDAESLMQQLCANNMAVQPGQVVYTGMLNTRGGFQTDCTITRLSLDK